MAETRVSESLVALIWQSQRLKREELTTEEGHWLRIVYPGQPNVDRGPDFVQAILTTAAGAIKGDVELHIRSSQWQRHQHHHDPAFNGVILHVVLWHDSKVPTYLQNGGSVPVLSLHRYLNTSEGEWYAEEDISPHPPCSQAKERLGVRAIERLLDSAGGQRFRLKTALFHHSLLQEEADQVLYQGIMRALGYTRNKEPFEVLARYLPLSILMEALQQRAEAEGLNCVQALLLGTAGLLSSPHCLSLEDEIGEGWLGNLQAMWKALSGVRRMSESDWRFFRIRPQNLPPCRLIAMSYLLLRYKETGLVPGIMEVVRGAATKTGYHALEASLTVKAGGYRRGNTLIGRGRAAEIALNAVLPFATAWGAINSDSELEEKALELYQGYPRVVENRITRQMSEKLCPEGGFDFASGLRQQGLTHIFNSLCQEGRCAECPLS